MPPWRGRKDWEAGRRVTEQDLDEYVSDNTEALYDRTINAPADNVSLTNQALQNTSGSFIDVPGTEVTLITTGGDLMLVFNHIGMTSSNQAHVLRLQAMLGSVVVIPDTTFTRDQTYRGRLTFIFPNIAAGSHTFQLQYVTNDSARLTALEFTIREIVGTAS